MRSTGKGGIYMLIKKLFRTMRQYKAQFISMIIMIALGIGIFVGFNMEWVSIDKNTSAYFKKTGFADYRITSEKGFSTDELSSILDIDGVENATRYLSVNVDIAERNGNAVALSVTENADVSGLMLMSGSEYSSSDTDGSWISDKYAAANNISVGDKITFIYKNINIETTV